MSKILTLKLQPDLGTEASFEEKIIYYKIFLKPLTYYKSTGSPPFLNRKNKKREKLKRNKKP